MLDRLDIVESPEAPVADLNPRPHDVMWRRIRWAMVAAYAVGYVWWFFLNGIIIDRISVLLSVTLFMLVANIGKPWQDWARMA